MTNKIKIYLLAVLLMIATFFLATKTIIGIKTGKFDVSILILSLLVLLVSVIFIIKLGKIENNK